MTLSLPLALILMLQLQAHSVLLRDIATVSPSHIDATEPLDQARFQCFLGDKTSPFNSTVWTYRGRLFRCNRRDRKFACGDTLVISNVKQYDSGSYECHVNQSGFTLTAYGKIIVAPALDDYELEIVKPEGNRLVNLSCPVSSTSYPQPEVLWMANGGFVSTGLTMVVSSAGQLASITYDCMAYNDFGATNVKSFRLRKAVAEVTPTTTTKDVLSDETSGTVGVSPSASALSSDIISLTALSTSFVMNFQYWLF